MTKDNEILTKVEGNVKQVGELKSEFVSRWVASLNVSLTIFIF